MVGGDNVDLSDPFLVNGFPVIRIIDPFGQAYTRGPDMPTGRWYPTLVTLPDGTIMIASGSQVGNTPSCRAPLNAAPSTCRFVRSSKYTASDIAS